jgi:hypothetical protein
MTLQTKRERRTGGIGRVRTTGDLTEIQSRCVCSNVEARYRQAPPELPVQLVQREQLSVLRPLGSRPNAATGSAMSC